MTWLPCEPGERIISSMCRYRWLTERKKIMNCHSMDSVYHYCLWHIAVDSTYLMWHAHASSSRPCNCIRIWVGTEMAISDKAPFQEAILPMALRDYRPLKCAVATRWSVKCQVERMSASRERFRVSLHELHLFACTHQWPNGRACDLLHKCILWLNRIVWKTWPSATCRRKTPR